MYVRLFNRKLKIIKINRKLKIIKIKLRIKIIMYIYTETDA